MLIEITQEEYKMLQKIKLKNELFSEQCSKQESSTIIKKLILLTMGAQRSTQL